MFACLHDAKKILTKLPYTFFNWQDVNVPQLERSARIIFESLQNIIIHL